MKDSTCHLPQIKQDELKKLPQRKRVQASSKKLPQPLKAYFPSDLM